MDAGIFSAEYYVCIYIYNRTLPSNVPLMLLQKKRIIHTINQREI